MERKKIILRTESLCPVCLKRINANISSNGDSSFMIKHCQEHGIFNTIVWKGSMKVETWNRKKERAFIKNPLTNVNKGCPYDCGLCSAHRQITCTALVEVTKRCNLNCTYCFADAYASGEEEKDPSLSQIKFQYESILKASGICNIQLSGGEPTVRNDLPGIIKLGLEMGFKFIQVNTNGIRIAEDQKYVEELKTAGLSSIFLQFDGTEDFIYKRLRGRELFDIKTKAIINCKKYGIGVVLVPTLVPGVNVANIGKIIDFGMEHNPAVRGVHFQPVSYFGRVPNIPRDEDRITLPQVMEEIEKQTGGRISVQSLKPPGCENALCSFHGNYILDENKKIMTVTNRASCCSKNEKAEAGAVKAKEFVSRSWAGKGSDQMINKLALDKITGWDKILHNIHNNSFSISAMAFQDVWNVDLERVKDCCIHVVHQDGRLIPFCLYNMTDFGGGSLYKK